MHARQHAHTASPLAPTQPSFHRYRQPPANRCPLCVRKQVLLAALPCKPSHWVCLGAAHRLARCCHGGELNLHHRTQPATPAATPPASHPSFFRPLTNNHST